MKTALPAFRAVPAHALGGADVELAAIEPAHESVALELGLQVVDEVRQRRHGSQELGLETCALVSTLAND